MRGIMLVGIRWRIRNQSSRGVRGCVIAVVGMYVIVIGNALHSNVNLLNARSLLYTLEMRRISTTVSSITNSENRPPSYGYFHGISTSILVTSH